MPLVQSLSQSHSIYSSSRPRSFLGVGSFVISLVYVLATSFMFAEAQYVCDFLQEIDGPLLIDFDFYALPGCTLRGTDTQGGWSTSEGNQNALAFQVGYTSGAVGARTLYFEGALIQNIQLYISAKWAGISSRQFPFIFIMTGCRFVVGRSSWTYAITFASQYLPPGSEITIENNTIDIMTNATFQFAFVDWQLQYLNDGSRFELSDNSFYFSTRPVGDASPVAGCQAVLVRVLLTLDATSTFLVHGNTMSSVVLAGGAGIVQRSSQPMLLYFLSGLVMANASIVLRNNSVSSIIPQTSPLFSGASALHFYSVFSILMSNSTIRIEDSFVGGTDNENLCLMEFFSNTLTLANKSSLIFSRNTFRNTITAAFRYYSAVSDAVFTIGFGAVILSGQSSIVLSSNTQYFSSGGVDYKSLPTFIIVTLYLYTTSLRLSGGSSLTISHNTLTSVGPAVDDGNNTNFRGHLYFFRANTILDGASVLQVANNTLNIDCSRLASEPTGGNLLLGSAQFRDNVLTLASGSQVSFINEVIVVKVLGVKQAIALMVASSGNHSISVSGVGTGILMQNNSMAVRADPSLSNGPFDNFRPAPVLSVSMVWMSGAYGLEAANSAYFSIRLCQASVVSSYTAWSIYGIFRSDNVNRLSIQTNASLDIVGNVFNLQVGGPTYSSPNSIEYLHGLSCDAVHFTSIGSGGTVNIKTNTLQLSRIVDGSNDPNSQTQVQVDLLEHGIIRLPVPDTGRQVILASTSGSAINIEDNIIRLTDRGLKVMPSSGVFALHDANIMYQGGTKIHNAPITINRNVIFTDPVGSPRFLSISNVSAFSLVALDATSFYFGSLCSNHQNYLENAVRSSSKITLAVFGKGLQCNSDTMSRTVAISDSQTAVQTPTVSSTISLTFSVPMTDTNTIVPTDTHSSTVSVTQSSSLTESLSLQRGCPTHCNNMSFSLADKDHQCQSKPGSICVPQVPCGLEVDIPYAQWAASAATTSSTGFREDTAIVRLSWPALIGPVDILKGSTSDVSRFSILEFNLLPGGAEITFTVTSSDDDDSDEYYTRILLSAVLIFTCFESKPVPVYIGLAPPPYPSPVIPRGLEAVAVVASVAGMASGSADLQTLAMLGLSSCAKGSAKTSGMALRSIAPAAISDSCEGAVIGNFIVVGAVLCLHFAAAAVLKVVRSVGWWAACDAAKFPSLSLMVVLFHQNGFLLCGFNVARNGPTKALGYVAVAWTLVPIAAYVVVAYRFVSRAFYPLLYRLPGVWRYFAMVLLPSGQLDKTIVGTEMFSTVVGKYQHPQPYLVLCGFIPFLASAPIAIGTGDLCYSMYGLAIGLHVIGALLLIYLRPFRVLLLNILQPISLALNAAVIGLYLAILPTPYSVPEDLATGLSILASVQTVFSVIKTCQTVLQQVHSALANRIAALFPYPQSCTWEVAVRAEHYEPFGASGPLTQKFAPKGIQKEATMERLLQEKIDKEFDDLVVDDPLAGFEGLDAEMEEIQRKTFFVPAGLSPYQTELVANKREHEEPTTYGHDYDGFHERDYELVDYLDSIVFSRKEEPVTTNVNSNTRTVAPSPKRQRRKKVSAGEVTEEAMAAALSDSYL